MKQGFLGIQDVDKTDAKIWSYGKYLFIDLEEGTKGEARIFDLMGREVVNSYLKNGMNTINIIHSGYYIALVRSGGKSITRKFYIQ